MQYQKQLQAEYEQLLAACKVTRQGEANERAADIIQLKPRYADVAAQTGVPILWLLAINERESASNMHTYLGNGQSLAHVTTLVPKGRGPFASWEAGAKDALHLDGMDRVVDWTWPHALYEGEAWNGFGPRAHGRHTGYLWAGTDIYTGGKYVADGVWNPNAHDSQLGTVPIMLALIALDGSLNLPGAGLPLGPIPTPSPVPPAYSGGDHGVAWLQTSLNTLIHSSLIVDASYGRLTRAAVREFQTAHGLGVDGVAGPATIASIEQALAA